MTDHWLDGPTHADLGPNVRVHLVLRPLRELCPENEMSFIVEDTHGVDEVSNVDIGDAVAPVVFRLGLAILYVKL